MKIIKRILTSINPGQVVKAFTRSDSAQKTKAISKMGGGGLVIGEGVFLVVDGAIEKDVYKIVGGSILLIIGVIVAERLGKQINEINESDTHKA